MSKIYIYGAGGHGLVVADIARSCGFKNIVFVDDGKNDFLGFDEIRDDAPIALGVGDNKIRKKVYDKVLECGFELITLIHPSSIISKSSKIGLGSVVMANVVVNVDAKIGDGAILNTSCVIEHEGDIGDFVHISPNVALAGAVSVGTFTHIGIGSSVIQCLSIGKNTKIGAGSVVVHDIADNKLAYGCPCLVKRDLDV
jgi:UDP-N-acetylbacillosamine N-acetyltransferase